MPCFHILSYPDDIFPRSEVPLPFLGEDTPEAPWLVQVPGARCGQLPQTCLQPGWGGVSARQRHSPFLLFLWGLHLGSGSSVLRGEKGGEPWGPPLGPRSVLGPHLRREQCCGALPFGTHCPKPPWVPATPPRGPPHTSELRSVGLDLDLRSAASRVFVQGGELCASESCFPFSWGGEWKGRTVAR